MTNAGNAYARRMFKLSLELGESFPPDFQQRSADYDESGLALLSWDAYASFLTQVHAEQEAAREYYAGWGEYDTEHPELVGVTGDLTAKWLATEASTDEIAVLQTLGRVISRGRHIEGKKAAGRKGTNGTAKK